MGDNEGTDDTGSDDTGTDDTGAAAADLGDPGKQALNAERRARKVAEKAAGELTAELERLRKSSLTEQEQKIEEARIAAVAEATGPLELRNARLEVALEKGLTKTQAARLVGNTPAELAADADAFLAELGAAPQKPAPSFNGGTRTTPEKRGGMNELIRQQAGLG